MFRAKTRSISPNVQRKAKGKRQRVTSRSKSKSKSRPSKKYIERYSMRIQYNKTKNSPKLKKVSYHV